MESVSKNAHRSNNRNIDDSLYSNIISPEFYNQIISHQHLYISSADNFLVETICEKTHNLQNIEVIELGCGPARILPLVGKIPHINLTGIDIDPVFITHANKLIKDLNIHIRNADIRSYRHNKPVTIFYSQGVHHHIAKGNETKKYLINVYEQLVPNGYYIVSDEFIPNYSNENEREINLIIWYCHIIDHALNNNFNYLAQEEAKTMLDDLYENKPCIHYKNNNQINLIFLKAKEINSMIRNSNIEKARLIAKELLDKIHQEAKTSPSGVNELDLSRKDYKICDLEFRREVESVGFTIELVKSFGPIESLGGMSVYLLKK